MTETIVLGMGGAIGVQGATAPVPLSLPPVAPGEMLVLVKCPLVTTQLTCDDEMFCYVKSLLGIFSAFEVSA